MKKLHKTVFNFLKKKIRKLFLLCRLGKIERTYEKNLIGIRKKSKVKVAFFVIHDSIWKCDEIYWLMSKHIDFEPIIVICPFMPQRKQPFMKAEMELAYKHFLSKGYNVVKTYDETSNEWLDVKKVIQPDVVFFTYPHKLTKSEYYIDSYLDKLTCYIPYGLMTANIQEKQYNQRFHNLIWRCYYETEIHKTMARKYALNKARNVIVTGYPMCDIFLNKTYIPVDKWKIQNKAIKRIIWAPHHTIENDDKELAYSNFLTHFQFILDIAERYKTQLQIAFKPHPVLKSKLYSHDDWGKNRTDAYYNEWQSRHNCQLEERDYEDLFLTSDAMLLDSVSFISEYLYTGKPSLFLVRDETIENKFNEYGKLSFNFVYKANNFNDILNFIDNTVLNKKDPLLIPRINFVNQYLIPPNNQTAGLTIFNSLISEIR